MKKIGEKIKNGLGEIIKQKIIEKYGDLKTFANELGISSSQLSNHLKEPKQKFLFKLRKQGISLEGINGNVKIVSTTISEGARIEQLEKAIREKDEIIQQYQNVVKMLQESKTKK